MCVYRPSKNSKIWWFEFRFENQLVRESSKSRSKRVAIDAERARRRELEEGYNGIRRRPRAKLFSVATDDWLALREADPNLAPASVRIDRDNLKHLRPVFDRKLAIDISADDVVHYQRDRLAADASPKTVNLEVGTLRAILTKERVWDALKPDVEMLAVRDDIGRCLSPAEEESLLAECLKSRSRQLYVFVITSLNTGMRSTEVRLLRWSQIDFSRGRLVVGKSKTDAGKGRVIPLSPRLASVLEMWNEQFPDRESNHYLFPFERVGNGGIYGTDPTRPIASLKQAWKQAKKRCGVRCRFHDLRHTASTKLLEAGVPLPTVASILGWSPSTTVRMAKRYGHIRDTARVEAVAYLGATPDIEYYKKSLKSEEPSEQIVQ